MSRVSSQKTAALLAIFGCFAIAGVLKIGDIADGAALAQTAETPAAKQTSKQTSKPAAEPATPSVDTATDAPASASPAGANAADKTAEAPAKPEEEDGGVRLAEASPEHSAYTPSEGNQPQVVKTAESKLMARLRERETELEAFAAALETRRVELEEAARVLQERIEMLEESKVQFEELVDNVNAAAERDVSHLISVYQKMKPKEASEIFDAMDPGFAAGFLARMKPDRAAAILAGMSIERAYAVSLQLAGRNVLPGQNQ